MRVESMSPYSLQQPIYHHSKRTLHKMSYKRPNVCSPTAPGIPTMHFYITRATWSFTSNPTHRICRPNTRSVAGAIFYLDNANQPTHINRSVHSLSTIIPSVVASVAEAEYAAQFLAGQEGVWLRQILYSLGYPQSPTTILCDNQCAVGIALDTIKPELTKSIDMRFHWMWDRIARYQFIVT